LRPQSAASRVSPGAKCLIGSPLVRYFRPAATPATPFSLG
jgi:hypothetical protein